jgi:tetratricopeptide (TPR) repeat protein
MNFAKFWLVMGLGILVPAVAIGQSPSPTQGTQQPTSSRQMYEDIEIMRRILNRKLGLWPGLIAMNTNCTVCHNVPVNHVGHDPETVRRLSLDLFGTLPEPATVRDLDVFLAGDHRGFDSAHASLSVSTNIEGLYLKGQGVVYTVTLPPPRRSFTVVDFIQSKTSSKPLTDWERARQSVVGDKSQPQKPEPVKETKETGIFVELEKNGHLGITEEILKILAENGHHFSQIAPDEKITVVITFREPAHMASAQSGTGMQAGNPLSAWGNNPEFGAQTWDNQPQAQSWEAQPQGAGNSLDNSGFEKSITGSPGTKTPASLRDYELLGDRLLKEGKAREAIRAFQQALNLNPPAKQTASLYRKIAQADLIIEDDAAAKKALEMAAENLKQASEGPKESGSSSAGGSGKAPSSPRLPAKLIIAAPKRLLDQMAAGGIRFEDFRKQAGIEYLGFAAEEIKSK